MSPTQFTNFQTRIQNLEIFVYRVLPYLNGTCSISKVKLIHYHSQHTKTTIHKKNYIGAGAPRIKIYCNVLQHYWFKQCFVKII